jgi:hypothetical protein
MIYLTPLSTIFQLYHGSQFYSIETTPLIKQFLIVEGMERGTVFTIGWPMIYLKMSISNSTDMLFSSPQIFSGVHGWFLLNKTDCHDITEILLKVVLRHYKPIKHLFNCTFEPRCVLVPIIRVLKLSRHFTYSVL